MVKEQKYYWSILTGMLLLLGLWVTSLYNYLLFHGIAELFSIVVACGIFMLAWNSRKFTKNSYFLFIGIGYLFIGNLDLIHTLAYKGMGIFPGHETNLSTQLWIAARYVESVSLLIAPLLIGRKLKTNFTFIGYILITSVLLGSIFYWRIFPVCFIEGEGLTLFKKVSEYIISFILLVSIVALFKKRNEFERDILRLLIASIVVTIASEFAFTLYVDVYGFSNLVGHYLKIISFYLIYIAIIKTGLTRPFALLFRDLKQSEDALRAAKEHLELEVGESSEKLQESIIKLHDSELRYRSVVEDSPGLICRFEAGGLITFVNDTYCNYFGKNQQELVGTSFFSFIPEEDRETVEANIAALTPEEPIQMHEHRVINPDGQIRWQRWTNRAIFDKDGQAREYQSFGEDITDRKRAEEELRSSEREKALVLDNTGEIIAYHDTDHNIQWANKAYLKATSLSLSELKGQKCYHAWVLGKLCTNCPVTKAIETGEHQEAELTPQNQEHWPSDQGSWMVRAAPVKDDTGDIIGAIEVAYDITERKQAEDKVRESEQKFRTLISNIPDVTWTTDNEGNTTFISSNIKEIYGYSPEEIYARAGQLWLDRIHHEDVEHVKHAFRALFETGSRFDIEYRIKKKNGDWIWLHDRSIATYKKDGIDYADGILTDITERKSAEEALRGSSEKLIKAGQVAHMGFLEWDLRTNKIVLSQEVYALFGIATGIPVTVEQIVDMVHPDDSEFVKKNLDMAIQDIRDYNIDHRMVRTDGKVVWVHARADLERDKKGIPIFLMGTVVDITDRKKAEEALQISETNLVKAQEVAHIGSWSLDLLENNLVWTDENYRIFGVSKGTPMTYEKFLEVVHPEDRDYVDKKWTAAIEGEPYDIEHRLLIDNEVKWVREKAELNFDDRGNPTSGVGITQDITERKRAEKLLKDSEARFRMIYEYAPVMIDAFDGNGRCVMWNKECEKVFGWTAKEIFSHENPLILFYPDPEVQRQVVETVTSKPEKVFREWKPRRKDGSETTCLWANFKLPDGLIINLGYDITERKRAEEKLHQYQQRLKALASELTVAEEKERRRIAADLHDNVQQSLALARIQLATARNSSSGDRLTALLDEISESMRQTVQNTRNLVFDLSSPSMNEIGLAAAISEWLEEQIQKRHGLKTEFIDECGRVPLDDDVRAMLFRSVRELLTNVVKHAKASQVNVCLKCMGDYLEIVVRDDGVGFDYTAEYSKMGQFGLFSIRERISDFGGSFEVESEPGKGCKAVLTAPLFVGDENQRKQI